MALLRLLVELYQTADLRLNLKFEIEVLLKAFKMEIKDVEPSTLLKARAQTRATAAAAASAPSTATPLAPTASGANTSDKFDIPAANSAVAGGQNPLFPGLMAGASAQFGGQQLESMALSAQAQAAYLAAAQSNPAVKRIVSVATERYAAVLSSPRAPRPPAPR